MSTGDSPNYKAYTTRQLEEALFTVDRKKYADRAQTISEELSSRKKVNYAELDQNPFATLLSRFIAYILDCIIVGISSTLFYISIFFINDLSLRNSMTSILKALLYFFYFGYFDSDMSKKASFGKQLLSIEVVSRTGKKVSWLRAGLRASYVAVFGLLAGFLSLKFTNDSNFLLGLAAVTLTFLFINELHAIVHPQKRRLVDVFFKTIVVKKNRLDHLPVVKNFTWITSLACFTASLILLGILYSTSQDFLNLKEKYSIDLSNTQAEDLITQLANKDIQQISFLEDQNNSLKITILLNPNLYNDEEALKALTKSIAHFIETEYQNRKAINRISLFFITTKFLGILPETKMLEINLTPLGDRQTE